MSGWLTDPNIWASFLTLTAMEVVLGIDNIVFLSVIVARLPADIRDSARKIGLALALAFRLALLFTITWLIGLTAPIFEVFQHPVSWRDIILIAGGLFLLAKGTREMHHSIEGNNEDSALAAATTSFFTVIVQIAIIDLIFSIDSIITAIGIAEHIEVMVAAIIISILVMYFAATAVGNFIDQHPTTKVLALSFLLLIGAALVADGVGFHIPRGYIYFSMAFAAGVEVVNVVARRRRHAGKSARTNR